MKALPGLIALSAVSVALAAASPSQDGGAAGRFDDAVRRAIRPAGGADDEVDPAVLQFALPARRDVQRAAAPEPLPWSPERLAGVRPDPRVRAWAADLASEDPARRDAASAALSDQSLPDEQVWLQLAQPPAPLGAEAHARLVEVCRSRLIDAPRGALGIQMARLGSNDGVTVTGLIANMPARKVLRAGDRIVSLDGRPVRNSEELSAIVQMKKPGQRIRVAVMRGERDALGRVRGGEDGKPVENRLELEMDVGSRVDLERFGEPGMDAMRASDAREQLVRALVTEFPGPVRAVEPAWLAGEPRDVESHPIITSLRDAVRRSEAAGGIVPQGALWRAQLDYLRGLARAPSLTPDERAYFEAVAARLEELVAEATADPAPGSEP